MFRQTPIDPDLAHSPNSGVITTVNNMIPAGIVLTVYLALTVINYTASFAIIRRKDV